MWTLSFRYDDEHGVARSRSIVLEKGNEYTIGRSVKSTLRIEDDKSISRIHLELKYDENSVTVINRGKLTYFDGKIANPSSEFKIRDQSSTFQIGSSPITIHIKYSLQEWKIPHSLHASFDMQRLNAFGIKVSYSFSRKSTLQIVSKNADPGGCLFAVIKGIPVVDTEFIDQINSLLLLKNCGDFEGTLSALLRRYNVFPDYEFMGNPLLNISIMVFEQKMFDMLKYTIEVGGGELILIEGVFQLKALLEKQDKKFLALVSNSFNPASSFIAADSQKPNVEQSKILESYEVSLYTITEFVNKILTNSLAFKFSRRNSVHTKELITSPSLDIKTGLSEITTQQENSEQPSQVRTKPKVHPLNSAEFFGGGIESKPLIERQQPQQTINNAQKSEKKKEDFRSDNNIQSPSDEKETIVDSKPEGSQYSQPLKHKKTRKRPLIKPLDNLMLRKATLNEDSENQAEVIDQKQIRFAVLEDENDSNYSSMHGVYSRDHTIDQCKISKLSTEKDKLSVEEPNQKSEIAHEDCKTVDTLKRAPHNEIHIPNCSNQKQLNIATAILETKALKNERLKANMVEVDKAELEYDALKEFEDVAVVSKFSFKRPKGSEFPGTRSCVVSRRNFKKFIKIWPVHMQKSHGSSPIVRNKLKSNTSQSFIRLHRYDPNKKQSMQIDTSCGVEYDSNVHASNVSVDIVDDGYKIETSSPSSEQENIDAPKTLFVQDVEEEEEHIREIPGPYSEDIEAISHVGENGNIKTCTGILNKSTQILAGNESCDDEDEYGKPTFNFRSRITK